MAAIVLMAATQLILVGFESTPLLSAERVDEIAAWLRRPPLPGAAMLAGIGLTAIALGLFVALLSSFGPDRSVITTRRRGGWTKLDRASLEEAIERRLESIDRRNDVDVRIGRRGVVKLDIVTPDPSHMGPAHELREAVDALCDDRALPCRSGRVTTTTPRRTTNRRRVR